MAGMGLLRAALLLSCVVIVSASGLAVTPTSGNDYAFNIQADTTQLRGTILTGSSPSSLSPLKVGDVSGPAAMTWTGVSSGIVQMHVTSDPTSTTIVSVTFLFPAEDLFYGVWEYPWNLTLSNQGVNNGTQGISGTMPGVNWSNARSPFFFSRSGWAIYVPTLEVGNFDFSVPDRVTVTYNTSDFSYYVLHGADPAALVTAFASLSSTIEMPTEAGYGPIFWSDDFEEDFHTGVTNAQENYYDVVNHLYYNQIRATAMVADRPYGTGNMSWGNFDFDPYYYPDPGAFIANLSAYGFDLTAWVGNRAFLDTELFNISEANGWLFPGIDPVQFLGPALNLSIPAAYDYFLERLTYFTNIGVKGYKIDRGEEGEMPVFVQNEMMTLFEQLCYESMAKAWGDGNFYNFARSSYDRSRSRTSVWNGDSDPTFEGLAFSVGSSIRAGLIGFAQWGSDTGGYLRTDAPESPPEEVWARWMHFSAFAPMYEILIGTGHTPWYPPYSSNLVSVLKQTAHTHTMLIPYIRSYSYVANQTGLPVVRALMLEYPTDQSVYEVIDEYAFGSEFLVAPIVTPNGTRSVYFPTGQGRFLDYFDKKSVYEAGSTLQIVDMSVNDAPVYVREGAIVPTGDIFQGNAKWVADWQPYLEIEMYPSFAVANSSFVYFRGVGNGTATIMASTNATTREVVIEHGDLGVDGSFAVYGKNGVVNMRFPEGGMASILKIADFVSLFE